MKFLNNLVCIVSFFTIGSVSAIRREKAPAEQVPAPTSGAPTQAPAPGQKQTYKQLHDYVLSRTQTQVFTGNKLSDAFISNTTLQARAAEIGQTGLKALLQTARDKFAPFTDKDTDNLRILNTINEQIETAAAKMV